MSTATHAPLCNILFFDKCPKTVKILAIKGLKKPNIFLLKKGLWQLQKKEQRKRGRFERRKREERRSI